MCWMEWFVSLFVCGVEGIIRGGLQMPDRGGGTRTWDPDKSTAYKESAEAFRAADVDADVFTVRSCGF